MKTRIGTVAGFLVLAVLPTVRAGDLLGPLEVVSTVIGPLRLKCRNLSLHGQIVDYTEHGPADRRIWSSVLQQRRSLYVYLPPHYDPRQEYPLVLFLHGIIDDERAPLNTAVPAFDKAIAEGRIPPVLLVIPDGHIPGSFFDSQFLNSRAGRYEDYLLQDVLPFVEAHFPVRPERQARAIMGFSMSGWAAYSVALKNTKRFGAMVGILPPLNMRWVDAHGRFRTNFDPNCWGWRTELDRDETIGWWYGIRATLRRSIEPYFGWGPEGLAWLSRENPIELLDRFQIQPGEIAMYVAYIRHDEFNVDAQVESFLYAARQRGLSVTVDYQPLEPSHTLLTAVRRFPRAIDWLGVQFAPYAPPKAVCTCHCH